MPKPAPPKYRTTNWAAYNAALKRRGSLDVWFDPDMQWLSAPCGRPGRPARFSDSAIELCLTLKALFNLPLRQATGLVASLLKLADLDWPVPDYTTLCRRQKALPVVLGGRPSSGSLHLLVDSTGIKMTGEGEWKTRKHGASYRRQWRKVHIGIDAETLDIRAIEVTTNAIGDAPVLPDLLAPICWHRSRKMSKSAVSVGTARTTPRSAMPRSPNAMRKPSFRSAATGDHGRKMAPVCKLAMKRSAQSNGLDGPSGRSGAAIIAAASSKLKCIASSCSASASWRAPAIVR